MKTPNENAVVVSDLTFFSFIQERVTAKFQISGSNDYRSQFCQNWASAQSFAWMKTNQQRQKSAHHYRLRIVQNMLGKN